MASTVKNNDKGGKRPGQKYKSLLVWNLLLKRTDENHAISIKDIRTHLEAYGIQTERHSISRDINDLTELLARDQELVDDLEERDLLGYGIEYDPKLHGYKVSRRPYEFDDLRLMAECVRAAKFISKTQEQSLLAAIEGFCSEYQIEELQNEVYLVGRNKTSNRYVMASMLRINQAIRQNRKISFKYLKYTLQSKDTQVERGGGATYKVSPYKLIINDGNYYLVAYGFVGKKKAPEIIHYRIDRMKEVKVLSEAREGAEVFAKIDMESYTRRVFSMFGGDPKRVSIRFIHSLLDAVIERFGTGHDVFYRQEDEKHFVVTADVEVSDQFFTWICGFGRRAKIVNPSDVVADMDKFLSKIKEMYESP